MRFWDASALSPLIVADRFTKMAIALARQDDAMMVWWASRIECASALSRRERESLLTSEQSAASWRRLERMALSGHEVAPSEELRTESVRLLRRYPLRAGDAQQLAAASLAGRRQPQPLPVVTFDDRLAAAARDEGFAVQGI
ncbi:MAG: type II toxin-antitoxin system VapC family toxin [Terriglobales bacterium]